MEAEWFRKAGKEMVDYVADYLENIRERRVLPSVRPGYLRPLIPPRAPEQPDSWEELMADVERVIMPGITHWESPQFHAFFPSGQSYPSMVADMLSGGINCLGLNWSTSPACTELEVCMMDWLGQALQLPESFLVSAGLGGGGVIQGSASDACLVAMVAARQRAIRRLRQLHPDWTDSKITEQLVAYGSDQAHSSMEKSGMVTGVRTRRLTSDAAFSLRGPALSQALQEDKARGLVPFFVMATLGTTASCAFDNLTELGSVCAAEGIWMHVDAAYAGAAFICEEFRPLLDGVENADSFNFNAHKLMLVNFDCSALWLKRTNDLVDAFKVDQLCIKLDTEDLVPEFRHWQIPMGRRFRSLKLWFVMRLLGLSGIREHVRRQVRLAHLFGDLVKSDARFELTAPVTLGLVNFRLQATNEVNECLLNQIIDAGRIYLVPCKLREVYMLRFAVCAATTEESDVRLAWREVCEQAARLVGSQMGA